MWISVFAKFFKKKVARKLILFEWWPIYFFSHNLFIKSVLAIGTLYSLIFCFFKVVYGIVFGVTPDIKIISFGVRQLKNRRVTPNGEEILSKYCIWTCLHYRGICCIWRCLHYRGLSCIWTCLHYRGVYCSWRCLPQAWAASGRVCTTEECAAPGGVYTTGPWAASERVCTTEVCDAPGGVCHRGLNRIWTCLHHRDQCVLTVERVRFASKIICLLSKVFASLQKNFSYYRTCSLCFENNFLSI